MACSDKVEVLSEMVLARMKCANKNLMRPDLLSEILLLGSAAALFGSILLIVVVAMSRA